MIITEEAFDKAYYIDIELEIFVHVASLATMTTDESATQRERESGRVRERKANWSLIRRPASRCKSVFLLNA